MDETGGSNKKLILVAMIFAGVMVVAFGRGAGLEPAGKVEESEPAP
ncbi:MAG: hypothetical protein QOF13_1956 [Solirubrobacterales bacterium]|jgi:hypothetical protein|nr:hypothetical protein [Solirubrobacterales bacterium]